MALGRRDSKAQSTDGESASKAKLWVIILVLLLALGGGGYFAYDWRLKQAEQQRLEEQQAAANLLGQSMAAGVRAIFAGLDAAIDTDAIGAVLESGDENALAAKTTELASVTEHVIRVRVLKPGHSRIDYSVAPPLSYATLDLLRRSEESGEAPPPEVHFKGEEHEHIIVVRRVVDGEDKLLGHLLLYLRSDVLRPAIARAQVSSGYAELQQTVAKGRPLVLGRVGNAAFRTPGPTATMPLRGTAWRAAYWAPPPEPAPDPLAALNALPVPVEQLGIGAAILLVGVGAMIVMRRRRAAARAADEEPEEAPVLSGEAVASGTGLKIPIVKVDDPKAEAEAPAAQKEVVGAAQEEETEAVPAEATAEEAPLDLPASIFRAYDIRGVVGETLSADVVRSIGRAIGSEAATLEQKTLVVGRDGRASSPELADALIEGIRAAGRAVVDIGQVPTPLVYFATHYLETGSGVMVTGSHNPPQYNGLKIMLNGETLFGDRIAALRARAQSGEFASGSGELQTMEIVSEYIRRVSEDVPVALGNAFRVVIDCGNGVAGAVAPQLIRALGHEVIELYCDVDGSFPNHHPDPSVPANLKDLIKSVKENSADIGFAFDGDGDRLGVVDSNGAVIFPDRQLMLFARDVLSRNPGAEIVFDVKCSSRLPKVIEKLGGKPVMWKTGHSFIKGKLKETGAPLGGEMSGHIFFKERWYGFDDAIYAAARMLEILMSFNQPPAEIFKKLPTGIATPELRVDFSEGEHLKFMQKFQSAADFKDAQVTTIDGLRVDFPDGWGLVRPSNTTPSLVLRFEADNKEALARIGGLFKKMLLGIDPNLKLPF